MSGSRLIVPGDAGIQVPFRGAGNILVSGPTTSQVQDSAAAAGGFINSPVGITFNSTISYNGIASGSGNSQIFSHFNLNGTPAPGVDGLISPFHLLIGHDQATSTTNIFGLSMKMQPDTGHTGGRSAIFGWLGVVGAPDVSTNNAEYAGIQGYASTNQNLGGTTGSLANNIGFLFGGNSSVFTSSGATFLKGITSWEYDTTLVAGSSAGRKHGIMIVQGSSDAVRGTYEDSAIQIASQDGGTAPWLKIIEIGSYSSKWPAGTDSTLIGVTQRTIPTSDTPVAMYGTDWLPVTFTVGGAAFRSMGFKVDPAGIITGKAILAAAGTTAQAPINLAAGVAPTSPADGDIWYDGTNIKMRVGASTKTFTLT